MRDRGTASKGEFAVLEVEACQKMWSVIAPGERSARPAQSHAIDRAADVSSGNLSALFAADCEECQERRVPVAPPRGHTIAP